MTPDGRTARARVLLKRLNKLVLHWAIWGHEALVLEDIAAAFAEVERETWEQAIEILEMDKYSNVDHADPDDQLLSIHNNDIDILIAKCRTKAQDVGEI